MEFECRERHSDVVKGFFKALGCKANVKMTRVGKVQACERCAQDTRLDISWSNARV